jgi:hypothetical protein
MVVKCIHYTIARRPKTFCGSCLHLGAQIHAAYVHCRGFDHLYVVGNHRFVRTVRLWINVMRGVFVHYS